MGECIHIWALKTLKLPGHWLQMAYFVASVTFGLWSWNSNNKILDLQFLDAYSEDISLDLFQTKSYQQGWHKILYYKFLTKRGHYWMQKLFWIHRDILFISLLFCIILQENYNCWQLFAKVSGVNLFNKKDLALPGIPNIGGGELLSLPGYILRYIIHFFLQ